MSYKWNSPKYVDNLRDVLRRISDWKNISKEQIRDFINFNIKPHDPYRLTNMDKVVKRIQLAFKNKERILILGDYDCDGIAATSVMFIGLHILYSDILWRVPHRTKDGYGINDDLIKEAYSQNVNLIITVDNGITAHNSIKFAKSLGMEVIVTDHHQLNSNGIPTELTINPYIDDNYPFKSICGCMVAFKLINALNPTLQNDNKQLYEELLIITMIATIADVMILVDENRYYVNEGLKAFKNCNNLGLMTLVEKLNLNNNDISVDNIGYLIAPCLNAAGRLESADIAINLLLTEDVAEAENISIKIIKLNEKRKEIQKKIINNISIDNNDSFIIIKLEKVEHGVIGIIAGEISGKYQKPCIILTQKNNLLTGSGRSVENYDIYSIIDNNRDFISGGGHASACGISIKLEDFDKLKILCNNHFNNWLKENNITKVEPLIEAICEIPFALLNERFIKTINKLKPYGNGNKEPLFITKNVIVDSYKIVGKNHDTLVATMKYDENIIKAIGFKQIYNLYHSLNYPKLIDIIYSVNLNNWNNMNTPQIIIKDLKILS